VSTASLGRAYEILSALTDEGKLVFMHPDGSDSKVVAGGGVSTNKRTLGGKHAFIH